MRVIIEIKGERHRLVRKGTTGFMDQCGKCSLRKFCRGRYNKNTDMINEVCHITYSGFRKIIEKTKKP